MVAAGTVRASSRALPLPVTTPKRPDSTPQLHSPQRLALRNTHPPPATLLPLHPSKLHLVPRSFFNLNTSIGIFAWLPPARPHGFSSSKCHANFIQEL